MSQSVEWIGSITIQSPVVSRDLIIHVKLPHHYRSTSISKNRKEQFRTGSLLKRKKQKLLINQRILEIPYPRTQKSKELPQMGNSASSTLPALQNVPSCDTARFMGTWFVIGVKPTMFETTCSNAVEKYSLMDSKKKFDVGIDFQYNKDDPITSPLKSLPQKGWVQGERSNSGFWKVSPVWPVKMPYHIIELDAKDYSYCIIGYPSRDYCWIMARKPQMAEDLYTSLTEKLVKKHQYSLEGLRKVPQKWTKAEREKRGLTKEEIPDGMLSKE